MRYQRFQYLHPPRPDLAIPSELLHVYESKGWIAQFKKNGTNTIIAISPDKQIITMNRHKAAHKAWAITEHIKNELLRLFPENKWFVLCAEIMHSKTPTIKDTIYIYDMLVWCGDFMYNSTFEERAEILDSRLITNVESTTHYVCDSAGKIWYAKRFNKNFLDLFNSIRDIKIDEGLVLKNPKGRLNTCAKSDDNKSWQVKCRHSAKNYAF